jgi:hypothetical protein
MNKIYFFTDISGAGDIENSDSDNSSFSPEWQSNKKRKRQSNDKDNDIKKSLLFGGSASEETLINKIVDLVTEKFKSSEVKTGKGNDLSPPTAELVSEITTTPLPFNNTILKNDDNDSFGKHIQFSLISKSK